MTDTATTSDETTPSWFDPKPFDDADRREVSVAGADIRYFVAAESSQPTLLFVHGARAHAHWWEPTVSLLAPHRFHWLAMDLSGHGDSDWRDAYSVERWADEVLAVAATAGGPVTLVGHSLGGVVSLAAAARRTPDVASVVSVDAVPRSRPGSSEPSGRPTWFASRREGAVEFAARDARRAWPRWLALRVGAQSLQADGDGFSWNHDVKTRATPHPSATRFDGLDVSRAALITGDDSFLSAGIDDSAFLRGPGAGIRRTRIAAAGHDVMMERPLEFVEALLPLVE